MVIDLGSTNGTKVNGVAGSAATGSSTATRSPSASTRSASSGTRPSRACPTSLLAAPQVHLPRRCCTSSSCGCCGPCGSSCGSRSRRAGGRAGAAPAGAGGPGPEDAGRRRRRRRAGRGSDAWSSSSRRPARVRTSRWATSSPSAGPAAAGSPCPTTPSSRSSTPGSSAATAPSSSRTWGPPTAPTSTASRCRRRRAVRKGRPAADRQDHPGAPAMIELRSGSATDVGLVRANNQDRAARCASRSSRSPTGWAAQPPERWPRSPPWRPCGRPSSRRAAAPRALVAAAERPTGRSGTGRRQTPSCGAWAPPWSPWRSSRGRRGPAGGRQRRRLPPLPAPPRRARAAHHRPQPGPGAGRRRPAVEGGGRVHPQRNVLTRAARASTRGGGRRPVQVLPVKGDRFLLCSDGLSARGVRRPAWPPCCAGFADPTDAARELVAEARADGGNDNITVVVVDVVDDDDQSATASPPWPRSRPGDPLRGGETGARRPTSRTAVRPPTSGRSRRGGPGAGGRLGRRRPPARLVTFRVVGFFVLLLRAARRRRGRRRLVRPGQLLRRHRQPELTIFKGRPGGLLWFQPTVAIRTGIPAAAVLPSRLDDLRSGKQEASLAEARDYVNNLVAEARAHADALPAPGPRPAPRPARRP